MAELLHRLTRALAGHYAVEREVGAGGMATVYLAEDIKHHRKVAVKVLRPELAATLGPERFFREIEIAAQLQHPHILPLLDSGEAEGFLYYVMPFVEGESLRERLARQHELPVPEAVRILLEVVDALAHAHKRGVVHRDIKPDNVMLAERHALVTDFGVAKAVSEATGRNQLTTAGVALGTPAYMAPEQAAADPHIDHRVDIYAVGAMGYELLSGRPPFTGSSPAEILAAHVTQAPEPVSVRRPAVPPPLAAVIMKCLAKRPADRWQSAEELRAQLEVLATPGSGTTPTATAPYPVAAPGSWYGHPIRVAALFTLASIAVLGVVYFLTIQLGLPDWVPWGAVALLGAGLPIMVVTGLIERRRARALAAGRATMSGETALHGWFTWRKATLGGVAAFALLGLLTLVYTAMRLLGIGPVGTLVASGKIGAKDRMIVADFVNRAADSTLGPSVTEAFRIDLAQSRVVNVVSSSEIADGLQRMNRDPRKPLDPTAAKELAVRQGAKAVVVGEISPVGRGFVLSAKLLAATGSAELLALRETAEDDRGILKAIDRLSGRMRERIGESLRTIRGNEPLEQVTTSSLEALRLYSQANHAVDLGEDDRAIPLLEQAIALDSGFAMANRKLAVALGNSDAGAARATEAAIRAFRGRDRLPEIERYQTIAYYYWTVDYDLDKVVSAYRTVLDLNPDDATALNNLGVVLRQRRQWAEAESLESRLIGVAPIATAYQVKTAIQLAQGNVAGARQTLQEFATAIPTSPTLTHTRAMMAATLGERDSAIAAFQELRRPEHDLGSQAAATAGLIAVELTRGRLTAASQYTRDFMMLSEKRGLPGDYLRAAGAEATAEALFRRNPTGGQRLLEEALRTHPMAKLAPLDRPYPPLATALAVIGQTVRAHQLLSEYEAAVPEGLRRADPERHQAAGMLALAEGRAEDAIREFRGWYDESGCTNCALFELGQAWELGHEPDSALTYYERAVTTPGALHRFENDAWNLARSYRRLGELYEARGDRDKALDYYGRFVKLWKNADAELQPQVKEVKDRMATLAGEK